MNATDALALGHAFRDRIGVSHLKNREINYSNSTAIKSQHNATLLFLLAALHQDSNTDKKQTSKSRETPKMNENRPLL
jgi:hypothetical protein